MAGMKSPSKRLFIVAERPLRAFVVQQRLHSRRVQDEERTADGRDGLRQRPVVRGRLLRACNQQQEKPGRPEPQ